jgi:hypothetical protein
MKKLLLSLCAMVLVVMGAGCIPELGKNDGVKGDWYLAFDLPEGWIMAKEYDAPRDAAVTPVQEVDTSMKTIVLQSTNKAIVRNGQKPVETIAADTYVLENYSVIDVYKLDPRFVVSKNAEDLGNGFVTADGKYFLTASDGSRYQFVIKTNGQSEDVAKQIILSAKLVTDYTGSPVSGTVTDVQTNEE